MFDEEFQLFTKLFFDRLFRKEIRVITSDLLEAELANAPVRVSEFYRALPQKQLEFVTATAEADKLAEQYIIENVVGLTSLADCQHIALATLSKADVLVSWNFQHIVNLKRIRGYNSVNLKAGLHTLEIRSPKELMEYEN
jgi:predicted nucleic acid-binding protein